MTASHRADIVAVIGATGSGKSLWIARELARRKPRRLVVWDPMAEYDEPATASLAELHQRVDAAGPRGALRIAYRPPSDPKAALAAFDYVCRLVYAAGHLLFVAEELSAVCKAGSAPAGWLALVTRGRHRGMSMIGTTQRPALVDKSFIDAATRIRCGRLNVASSQRAMADALNVPVADLAELRPLQWVERDMATGAVRRETIAVPKRTS